VVRLHLKPTIGGVKLDKLNALQVQTMYSQKLNTGLSARSVGIIHVALHKALKQTVRWSLVPRNVAEAVTPPRPPKREITPLTHQQLRALLETALIDKLYALWSRFRSWCSLLNPSETPWTSTDKWSNKWSGTEAGDN
jgi:integrase